MADKKKKGLFAAQGLQSGIQNSLSDLVTRYAVGAKTGDYSAFNQGVETMRAVATQRKWTSEDFAELQKGFKKATGQK